MLLDEIEKQYLDTTSIEHRKKYAQFFTPPLIADLMVKWLLGNKDLKQILEPAFGLGIFSRMLLKKRNNIRIKGFEVDKNIYNKSRSLFGKNKNISIQLKDYMYNDWKNKYDGIICNPPYFKFHDYDNKNILNEIEKNILCKLNGFTNLYSLFLLKSIYQLNKNGRAAYIIPSEFLNSDYGKLVKSYLVKNGSLRHVIIINFKENVFDDVLTTASILLFANDHKTDAVQFSNISSLSDLSNIEKIINTYPKNVQTNQTIKFKQLNPEIKWRAYYQEQNSIKFKHLVPFAKYGKVVRGIATGANEYFIFNLSKAKQYNIPKKYLIPCICRATDVKNLFFGENDIDELINKNKNVFLIDAVNSNNKNVERYLSIGEKREINKKYLTASRNPWYSLEKRLPAPIWVSVFNRNGLRFIRNEAKILNLTTFHCLYLNIISESIADLFFSYLLTDISKEIFDDNSREYGNGLQKFEPNDINKSKMIDLSMIDERTEKNILKIYKLYRQSVIDKKPEEKFVKEINKIFLEKFTETNFEKSKKILVQKIQSQTFFFEPNQQIKLSF
ncbi:SAM-dependent methyltransferase [Patescibacteria group bacterium]|nr:SAM-dependent methyltransferase [Patescibacteria group bacterium]